MIGRFASSFAAPVRLSGSFAFTAAAVTLLGCGNNYRPVVSAINPVGPAGQPTKYAVVATSTGSTSPGLVNIVDVSGDTILDTTAIGANPQYLQLSSNGGEGYTLNGDGTFNSFSVSTSLIASNVAQTTLPPGANPLAIFPATSYVYVAENGRNAVARLSNAAPPAVEQELQTGAGTVYTVGVAAAPRAYALAQGSSTSGNGTASAIDIATNTITATLPVGVQPVYGVVTADTRRAFILNKGSNSVSVINSQTNALDTFTNSSGVVTGTIPVGTAPVWADFAPTLNELVVANAGNGTTPGSVSIVTIPLCSATAINNPLCDTANPVDGTGFGTVVATIPVGINPVMVAVLQDGTQAYVANAGNATNPGSVSVINLTTNTVTATLTAGASINEADSLVHGHPAWIAATTGTPTGKVYVTALDSTDLTVIRTDTDTVQTHLALQGYGVNVRVTLP